MIDEDDVDFAMLSSSGMTGWAALAAAFIILALAFYACENTDECAKRHCPNGQKPKLMKHECLCVTEAQP